mmetsp:Transcript_5274/g.15414  ORF Transcript_5274/g.15414 Transcript_5274/m.15414 type:complete len:249 (+) Transcript_5274:175-921(+)
MGASGSVLMATIVLESFIPDKCWIAPEMPHAMYRSGATTFPVCPTCQSFGQNPASTAARDAPTAAPNLSANRSSTGKLSELLIPRPPLTTMEALPKSGRSDLLTASPAHMALSKGVTESTVSISPASTRSAFSKLVERTDRTLMAETFFDLTFANTFPAYIGLVKVSASWISMISVIGDTFNNAAARGMTVDPNFDAVPKTTDASEIGTTVWIADATVSASRSPIGTWYTFDTPAGTLDGADSLTTSK